MSTLLIGFVGGVFGFFFKSLIDFYISSNKDSLKDLKGFLTESIKSIDEISDLIEKDVFAFYTSDVNDLEKKFKILKIQNNFKRLGVLINEYNIVVRRETRCSNIFSDELFKFRSASTLDIHNHGNAGFNPVDKLLEVQSRYLNLKNKIFILKKDVGLYQIYEHSSIIFFKIKSFVGNLIFLVKKKFM